MTHTPQELHEIGETLRQEQGVVWALIRGRGGEARIAWLLGWSPKMVKTELQGLKKQGLIQLSSQGTTWSFTPDHPQKALYEKLSDLYYALELKVAAEYPSSKALGSVSARARAYLETAEKAAKPARSIVLSEAQLKRLREAYQHMGDETFSTKEFCKAIGFRKDYMIRGVLEQLAKKGYVSLMEDAGPGHWWQVTPQGIEAVVNGGAPVGPTRSLKAKGSTKDPILELLSHGPMTTKVIADARGITRSSVHKQLTRRMEEGKVRKDTLPDGSSRWELGTTS